MKGFGNLSASLVALLVAACLPGALSTSGGETELYGGVDTGVDSIDVNMDIAELDSLDSTGQKEQIDTFVEEVFDYRRPLDTEGDLELLPGPGEPGYPCQSGQDCDSGFCVTTVEGRQCTVECQEECPFGWECVLHKASMPNEI